MTLLTIVQNAADELGLDRPTDVVNSSTSDATVRQLLALANREGNELSDYRNWNAQNTITTITTVAGQEGYDVPSDFSSFLNDTQWDLTNHWALIGPLSAQEWEMIKSGIVTVGPRRRFRQFGTAMKIYINPTPSASDAGNTLRYEYSSKNWCQSATGTGQSAWAADDDTGILDEKLMTLGLKWRFLRANQFDFSEEKSLYEEMCRVTAARDGGAPVLTLAPRRRLPFLIGPANIPEAGFGS